MNHVNSSLFSVYLIRTFGRLCEQTNPFHTWIVSFSVRDRFRNSFHRFCVDQLSHTHEQDLSGYHRAHMKRVQTAVFFPIEFHSNFHCTHTRVRASCSQCSFVSKNKKYFYGFILMVVGALRCITAVSTRSSEKETLFSFHLIVSDDVFIHCNCSNFER